MEISKDLLRAIIREVLEEAGDGAPAEFEKAVDRSSVLRVKASTVKCTPYDVGVPAKVALKDVVTLEEGPRMGCGILEIDHSAYPWTLRYDEFYYVVDGVLEIFVDGRGIRGSCGDILYIPRGTSVQFSSPETVRAVYFTYPADWENAAE